MGNWLSLLIVAILQSILKTWLERKDLKDSQEDIARLKFVAQNLEAAQHALNFEAYALDNPLGAAALRVRWTEGRLFFDGPPTVADADRQSGGTEVLAPTEPVSGSDGTSVRGQTEEGR